MKDNKLIAEFMGLDAQILSTNNVHSWNDAPFYYITKDSKEKVMEGISEYSKYHTSWDWLMPVLQKCRKDNRLDYFDIVYYALEECDIDITYKAVVEFINQLNNNNNESSK